MKYKVLVSVIKTVVPWSAFLATTTHLLYQFRSRLILQLIKDISRVLQKLLRYFNFFNHYFTIFCAIVFCLACYFFHKRISSRIFILKSVIAILDLKPVYLCNIAIEFQMFLNNYHYILLHYTLVSLHHYHEHHLFVCCLFCLCSY